MNDYTINIDLESTFKKIIKSKINIFTGPRFSSSAKNRENEYIPQKEELKEKLIAEFKLPNYFNINQLFTLLEKTKKEKLYSFLRKHLLVNEIPSFYQTIDNLSVNILINSGIDNLIEELYKSSSKHYLNNLIKDGDIFREDEAILYMPVNGNIKTSSFDEISLTTKDILAQLSINQGNSAYILSKLANNPVLFLGYTLEDFSSIESLVERLKSTKNNEALWILLDYESNEHEADYFRTLGFNIIKGNISSFFNYLQKNIHSNSKNTVNISSRDTYYLFPKMAVPKKANFVRPIKEFYIGAPPVWSDIITGNIHKTSHYRKIINEIDSNQDLIFSIGISACGKTTLLMQIAYHYKFHGHKLVTEYIPYNKTNQIIDKLNGEPALIFVDNFTDCFSAVEKLASEPNIKVIAFDREYNFEIIRRKISISNSRTIYVTGLDQNDVQEIYNKLPQEIRKRRFISPKTDINEVSLFEFVKVNLTETNIEERFTKIFHDLEEREESDVLDFLVMCCYAYACRIPVSADMAMSFLDYSYEDVNEVLDILGKLITDYNNPFELDFQDQDYYTPRSNIVAETIIKLVPSEIFRDVLEKFHSISTYKICRYNVFKRYGYDSKYIQKAFPNWVEGMEFYEKLYQRDLSPYLLQQGALYLSYRKKFNEAFEWIDKSLLEWRKRYHVDNFTILNTHAIILFEANIKANQESKKIVIRQTLDQSMDILLKCYKDDRRKFYHAKVFAEQAILYWEKYHDSQAEEYLLTSISWLEKELDSKISQYDRRGVQHIKRTLKKIKGVLENN